MSTFTTVSPLTVVSIKVEPGVPPNAGLFIRGGLAEEVKEALWQSPFDEPTNARRVSENRNFRLVDRIS
jgi:hypothetical protein